MRRAGAAAPRVALMASGKGSTVRALVEARAQGRCDVQFAALVTDRPKAGVVGLARDLGVETHMHPLKKGQDRARWDLALAERLDTLGCELIVLAGFMRILGPAVIERFEGRIVNIHPSLLPAFPGKDAPAQALAAGVSVSGCSVHLVDAGVDSGPILGQAAIPVLPGDDAASLHARIQEAERVLYPNVIHAFAHGRDAAAPSSLTLPSGAPALIGMGSLNP